MRQRGPSRHRRGTPGRGSAYNAASRVGKNQAPSPFFVMRIIAGSLRRRALSAPRGLLTRPTTDRVREAIFNLVEARLSLSKAAVLDLFAGTGSLGIEALSRGAASARFVERHARVFEAARRNAASLDVSDQCQFLHADAVGYLERYRGGPFDLIFADPPYHLAALARLPHLATPHLLAHGLFVLEHDARMRFDAHPNLETSRPYGRTIVSVFGAAEKTLPDPVA